MQFTVHLFLSCRQKIQQGQTMKHCQRGFVSNTPSTTVLKILPWFSFRSDFFFFFLIAVSEYDEIHAAHRTGFHSLLNRQGHKQTSKV